MKPTPQNALRLGFIGGGVNSAIGYTHFNASRMDGHFLLQAGCFSRDADLNAASANAYGVDKSRAYKDWRTMLAHERGNLDAVAILTPIPQHLDMACVALSHGFPVICEKPLALSSEECGKIQTTLAEQNGYLAVTLNYSGYPMVRQLRDMIREGRLGNLQQILVEMPQESFSRQGATPQEWRQIDYAVPTVSLDLGTHVHHLIHFLTSGLQPVRVCASHDSFGQFPALIDNVHCIAEYQKGVRVQAWWGKTALGSRNGLRVRVYGTKASADWYQMDPEFLRWADDDGHHYTIDRASGEAKLAQEPRYNRFKAGHPSGFIEAFANLYRDIYEEISSFTAEETPAQTSQFVTHTAQSAAALAFLEGITRAARTSKWVEFGAS